MSATVTENRPEFAEERRRRIAELVRRRGSVRIVDLVEPMGVSEPTLRKDLSYLEGRKVLKRTHGGAIAVEPRPDRGPGDRGTVNVEAKRAIAKACAALVGEGQSVYVDAGTTTTMVAEELPDTYLNVVTNSVPVVQILGPRGQIRHTLLGGRYHSVGESVVGPIALENLERFTVDVAFVGISGITAEGITVSDVNEGELKKQVISSARRVVVACDSSKVGQVDFSFLVPLGVVDDIVTEAADPELVSWCEGAGVRLHVTG